MTSDHPPSNDSLLSMRRTDSASSFINYLDSEEDDPHINKLWRIHRTIHNLRGKMSKQQLDGSDVLSDDLSDESAVLPPTYLVLKIASDIKENTIMWLIDKIRGKRRDGGAELIIMRQPTDPEQDYALHLSASKIKFLESAEEMELMKEDKSGVTREFTVAQLEDFLPEGMHVDDLLTVNERQTIVRHELENIRALAEDEHIPGYPTYKLYEGQSIFQVCLQWKIITQVYPLHDQEALKKLGHKWYFSFFSKQPFEEIRQYFGEAIALYFTFLGFYTAALSVPVLLGFLQLLVSSETSLPFFCVFNVVWVTVVLEMWKRKSNSLAFKWGTIGMTSLDEPRPNFRGSMGYDAVTGKLQPQHPRYFTYIKMYCVSIPLVLLCMIGAFIMMLASFWCEDYLKQIKSADDYLILLPSIVYTILVYIVNLYYRTLATHLTEWENHRTQSQHDRHRVTKLVLFEFVNNFMSLFYIAFIIQDMEMLRSQLQTMLIISQAINNLQEAVLPLAFKYYASKIAELKKAFFGSARARSKLLRTISEEDSPAVMKTLPLIPLDDARIDCTNIEGDMEDYEGTFDDYLELFIQFGYVFLFSSAYPMAAFWAVLNNILEIRADAFKLCKVFKRPMSRRVKDIGAWQRSFEILGAMSIMTNCGLLFLSPQLRRTAPEFSQMEWLLFFVFLEHVLLGIRYLLHITISEKPEWVRVALAKRNYESKQALKFERAQKNRRLLTRKFKTVHGTHVQ